MAQNKQQKARKIEQLTIVNLEDAQMEDQENIPPTSPNLPAIATTTKTDWAKVFALMGMDDAKSTNAAMIVNGATNDMKVELEQSIQQSIAPIQSQIDAPTSSVTALQNKTSTAGSTNSGSSTYSGGSGNSSAL